MSQQNLFDEVPIERYHLLSKDELVVLAKQYEKLISSLNKDNGRLRALNNELKQKSFLIEDQLITIKNKLFGKSSERVKPDVAESNKTSKKNKTRILLPSERYPNLPLIERHVTLDALPACKCCGTEMQDSGMTEDSEFLTKIPAQYYVVVQMRHKYRCGGCHGDIHTAPNPPKVKDGSSYSDEMTIDVAMTKYCDLIPIDRYARIAEREGVKGLPPQSLIESTHSLADFVKPVYEKLKEEIKNLNVLHADETPHRMLEGDARCSWYLWGFSGKETSYFECHNTRSGGVASELLKNSRAEYLMSDVYSGYGKAIRDTNIYRGENGLPILKSIYCNAHARRYFVQAHERFEEEMNFFIKTYQKIYRLEKIAQARPQERVLRVRRLMEPLFKGMRDKAMADIGGYSDKSAVGKAMNYFLKNYDGFIAFIKNKNLPIDNNPQERLLRSPVVGRKTWYGTHSKRGAETMAIMFSLVESCKMNKINPREYIKNLVQDLHQGKKSYTPSEYKNLQKNQ